MMSGMPSFAGFPPEARQFLRDLRENNRRDWFRPRKADFERWVKEPMVALGFELGLALEQYSPGHCFDPRRSVYRIYRDVRFSKNKDPYKTHAAMLFPAVDLGRHQGAGFYFHFSADDLLVGGGLYRPTSEGLRRIREKIAGDPETLRSIVTAASLRERFGGLQGDRLKRTPRGYSKDHPAADLLKYKQFLVGASMPAREIERPTISGLIDAHFRAAAPLMEYLNGALGTD